MHFVFFRQQVDKFVFYAILFYMNMIRPVVDLENNLTEIADAVHESGQPVFLTKDGFGDMVLMSM